MTKEQKQCPYCHAEKDIISGEEPNPYHYTYDFSYRGYVQKNAITRGYILHWESYEIDTVGEIRFCPMCGRKLVNDDED